MKKTLFAILICGFMVLTLTGCGNKIETNDNVNKINKVSIDELNDINNKIIFYFNDNGTSIIVGLVDNSEEEQEWFRRNIVDSKYIRFEQGNHPVNE